MFLGFGRWLSSQECPLCVFGMHTQKLAMVHMPITQHWVGGCWDKKVDVGNLKQRALGSVRVLSKKEGIYREADTDIFLWSLYT